MIRALRPVSPPAVGPAAAVRRNERVGARRDDEPQQKRTAQADEQVADDEAGEEAAPQVDVLA